MSAVKALVGEINSLKSLITRQNDKGKCVQRMLASQHSELLKRINGLPNLSCEEAEELQDAVEFNLWQDDRCDQLESAIATKLMSGGSSSKKSPGTVFQHCDRFEKFLSESDLRILDDPRADPMTK